MSARIHMQETIISDTPDLSPNKAVSNGSTPHVDIVEGTGPHFTSETQSLLRYRLRMATFALAGGFGIFLVWHSYKFFIDPIGTESSFLLSFHALLTLTLAVTGFFLCPRCNKRKAVLRAQEAIVFGLPAIFFMLIQYDSLKMCAEMHKTIYDPAPAWLLLIFTYALFIPNNWQRAAVVIGAMALAPIGLIFASSYLNDHCASVMASDQMTLAQLILIMLISGSTALLGVCVINNMRNEAFKAKRMGQYHLRRQIGHGGMGEVYLAEHSLMKRPCAIKIIRPDKQSDDRVMARFEREVHSTSKLSHWNNIDIYDYGRTNDGTFYYVMEFLPGLNLSDLVKRFGPIPASRVIYLLKQTCEALEEAHNLGLLHRDIKPANVFAAFRGGQYDVAKLLDFGLAKPISSEQEEDTQLTQDGTITGSPLYMSPEQASGEGEVDERSDIYSLGVLAYYMLTGQPPFNHAKPIKVIIAHAHEKPELPSKINDQVPNDLEEVVLRCLEKDPEHRYQTARELFDALTSCESANAWTKQDATDWWTANESIAIPDEAEEVAVNA